MAKDLIYKKFEAERKKSIMSVHEGAALTKHIQKKMKEPEYNRILKFGKLLEHFHLKHTVTDSVDKRNITINGKEVINFGSANYLGLEQHPEVIKASVKALNELGTHAGCSRIFSSHENMVRLEMELSDLVHAEKTLIGHNISQIHAGVIPTLFSSTDCVLLVDRFAHTSIFQACLMAKAKGAQIEKVDVSDLSATEKILQADPTKLKVLFVDGVYSMQGHIPPLKELDQMCKATNTILYIDDAHGVGVYGTHGGGVMEELVLDYNNILLVSSLQKAFGTYGGFISGRAEVIDYLRSTSKAYIFSGTLQPSAVEGARKAVEICRSEEGKLLRNKIKSYSQQVRVALTEMGYQVPRVDSPIVPVLIGEDMTTMMAGRKLFDLGIFLNSVLYPAVPKGEGILRISLTALHSEEEIHDLIESFAILKDDLKNYQTNLRGFLFVAKEVVKSKLQGEKYSGL